jgi:hypothetical protein
LVTTLKGPIEDQVLHIVGNYVPMRTR